MLFACICRMDGDAESARVRYVSVGIGLSRAEGLDVDQRSACAAHLTPAAVASLDQLRFVFGSFTARSRAAPCKMRHGEQEEEGQQADLEQTQAPTPAAL